MTPKQLFLYIIIPFVVMYIFLCILLYLNQRSLIYFPGRQDFNSCAGFRDYEKLEHKGTRFYFKNASKSALVYYHGNAGSACDRAFLKPLFERSNRSILFVEYTGYSSDKKKPSMKAILADIRNIHDFLEKRRLTKNTVVGLSIGASAAAYHASLGGVDKVLLIAPFSTMEGRAKAEYWMFPVSLLLTEKYDNVRWLSSFKGDVMIIHGDADRVIPDRHSRKLFETLSTEKKEYVSVNGYGHNDIWDAELTSEKVNEFIQVT
jgi:pimeloyl-ACP methyl ester carboxylesterase